MIQRMRRVIQRSRSCTVGEGSYQTLWLWTRCGSGDANLKLAVCLPFNVIADCSAEAGQSRMDGRGKAEIVQMFNQ